ncbi:restriction endonuclease subunit S [Lacibacter sp.]|uniref:restriction endonuclease subunit S n=1 Tax=Lacibacter sp. TaxID=1915409 RepID=UPI002B4AC6A1|nr:restriction endonuclease subunit S [Lacibacter sp.]HLP37738.1 restriction endonuclease subunit S [Lacibacter sp.]
MEATKVLQKQKLLVPKLRFKGFDGEWSKKQLNSIVEKVNSGKTPLGGNSVYVEEGILFIRSQNVLDSKLSYENSTFITKEINDTMKNSIVKPNDILLNITGASLGRSCVVPKEFTVGNVNQHVCIIRLTKENEPYFLQPIFESKKGQNIFSSLQTGSGREGLNFQSIKKIILSIPTLTEQQKIASFLSAVDEKIQQLTRKKGLLEQYKKGVMQQLFSGKLKFKDENGKAFPEWEEKRLGDVSVFLDGRRKPIKSQDRAQMKGEFPYYGASGIIDYVNQYLFDEEIILLGEDGENIVSRNLPLAFKVSGKCWVNNHAHVIKPNQGTDIDFLTYSLERVNYVIYNTGTAQPKLNQEVCRNIPLSMPSFDEQKKIANYLSNIDNKIESVNKQIAQTQTFKKGLLQQMFV